MSEKVGTVSGSTYTNEYANFTLNAPNDEWTITKGDDYYTNLDSNSLKTDENGKQYVASGSASLYYDVFMTKPATGATAQVMIVGVDGSSSGTLKDIREGVLEGLTNSNSGFTLKTDTTEKYGNNEFEVKDYVGEMYALNVYEKVLIKDLDDNSTMVVLLMSTDKNDIKELTDNIS